MRVDVKLLKKKGVLIQRNVFTTEEIESFRNVAYKIMEKDEKTNHFIYHLKAKNHLGCLSNIDETFNIIFHDKIIELATKILGEKPVFFGDAIFEIGIGGRGWHKDVSYTKDKNHEDWKTKDYPIYRFALYLQDHSKHSGGLKIKEYTQNTLNFNKGKAKILDTCTGDVAIFNLRTTHAGNAVRLKSFPEFVMNNRIEKRIPKFLRIPEKKERIAFFITFGLKSSALDRYINFMQNHKVYKKRLAIAQYPESLVQKIEKKAHFINLKTYKPTL